MEKLQLIVTKFEKIKRSLRSKSGMEWAQALRVELQALRCELAALGQGGPDALRRALAMEGYLALLSVKTLPMSVKEKHTLLESAFEKLKPFMHGVECLFVFLRIQNLLCYYLIQLENNDQCREILEDMEKIYEDVPNAKFVDAEDLFVNEPLENIKQVNPDKIDKVITNNIQMQAFLYNKMNLPEKYVLYNHTALRRQLEIKEGTPQDWAVRAARLGNYFTYLNQMCNARHHLCAAYFVLRSCHDRCKLIPTEFMAQKADFEMYFLELSHYFVKYGLNLFKISKKKILNRYFNQSSATSDLWKTVDFDEKTCEDENSKDSKSGKTPLEDSVKEHSFTFPTLDLAAIEAKVPSEIIYDVEDARKVFIFTHKWLMRARRYYNFELQPSQYTSCALQLAELYESLAFFERTTEGQYNVQKRRADVLESLNALLKSCDNMMPVQIDVIRELSQVQLELMALNLQKLWCQESQMTFLDFDNDVDSLLGSASNKTLTVKTPKASSKNLFLKRMDAALSINSRLFRLSGSLVPHSPSQVSSLTKI